LLALTETAGSVAHVPDEIRKFAQLTYYTHDAGASLHRMEPLRYTIVQLKKSDMAC
jgi:hypothetical protein